MTEFTKAVTDAQAQLHKRGFAYTKATIYAHPNAVKKDLNKNPPGLTDLPGEPLTFNGTPIETTKNVPENVVMAVILAAKPVSPEAVAFETIEEVSDDE